MAKIRPDYLATFMKRKNSSLFARGRNTTGHLDYCALHDILFSWMMPGSYTKEFILIGNEEFAQALFLSITLVEVAAD